MSPGLRKFLGWCMSLVGFAAMGLAAWVGWSAWARVQAIDHLHQAADLAVVGKLDAARRHARQAELDGEAAAEILGADLVRSEDRERLARSLSRAAGPERESLAVALGLGRVLAGEKPEVEVGASDAKLLAALTLWRAGKDAPWPSIDRQEPPHRAVLACAYEAALSRAVQAGHRDDIVTYGRSLLLLQPQHAWRTDIIRWLEPPAASDMDAKGSAP